MIEYFDNDAFNSIENRYALVIAVAKRARELVDLAEETKEPGEYMEQPVSTVLRELGHRKIEMIEC